MSAGWLVQLNHAHLSRGENAILDDVTLALQRGAKIGVVGPNGAGKSSLLKLVAGLEDPTAGDAIRALGTSVGILIQEPVLDESTTVLGNVEEGAAETLELLSRYEQITAGLASNTSAELLDQLGDVQHQLDLSGAWDLDARLTQAMEALRCPPPDAEARNLSGGQRRRVALCRLLLQQPDLLLLDEPTNHLDAESVVWLEGHLQSYPGTVMAVTHDRYFLDNIAEWILELDRGHLYPYQGNYTTYLATKQERLTVEGKRDAKQRKRLQEELDWVRSAATPRHATSASRLTRYEEMAAKAQQTRALDFEEIQIPPGPRLGDQVIEVTGLSKGFDGQQLISDLSFTLPRNGIVGVLGPNGVGKTTLFEMLAGRESPDAGTIRIGDTVTISYVDQSRSGMDSEKTAWELISDGQSVITVGRVEIPSRAYVAAFGFKGASQQKPVRLFSGGERSRLNLALTLKQGGNVLLLDEPTNDLDTETLASLESALLEFPGCVVVSAHDRWFLDRVATHILAWEGSQAEPGHWFWFEGNFADYGTNRVRREGNRPTRPTRIVHRQLVRG
jgi:ATP-binding cassette ChvD family protein